MTPELAAIIVAAVSLILSIYNSVMATRFDKERVVADYNAVRVIRKLLKHEKMPYRSFSILRHYVGGFSDDELRKLLVRAGAIRAISADDREVWALWRRAIKYTGSKNALPARLGGKVQAYSDDMLFPAKLPKQIAH